MATILTPKYMDTVRLTDCEVDDTDARQFKMGCQCYLLALNEAQYNITEEREIYHAVNYVIVKALEMKTVVRIHTKCELCKGSQVI